MRFVFAFIIGFILCTYFATSHSHCQETSDAERFLDGFFPIGVFSQPADSMKKWRERGINTFLETPQNHDPIEWDRAAQRNGLRIIRRPLPNPRDDIGRKDLLAWSHWDEPDAAGRIFEWTPLFERTYAEWQRIDPQRKIFINFAGPDISWFTARDDEYSRNYAAHYPRLIATADWIANDIYPCAGWLNRAHESRRGDVTLITEPIKVIRTLTGKPQFAFIETSEIEHGNVAGARCPTPGEVRAQIWLAIIHGVRGLFYFPAVVGTNGFQFDGTPPEVVDELKLQNAILTELSSILQGPINPKNANVIIPAPLQAGWRIERKRIYIFVVNPTSQPQPAVPIRVDATSAIKVCEQHGSSRKLSVTENQWHDEFAPFGVNIYLAEFK
ncbi:MAG TPA: hypothetical protein PKA76_05130 [Pirellulaceae bacterium]|nr:hypothetical protein [Pirellulaceae bacterium]HMP68712.1 hypothetical protein [Pirellulaceae bacterium]